MAKVDAKSVKTVIAKAKKELVSSIKELQAHHAQSLKVLKKKIKDAKAANKTTSSTPKRKVKRKLKQPAVETHSA